MLEKMISNTVLGLCAILFSVLFVLGFCVSAVSQSGIPDEYLVLRSDSMVWNLLGLCCAAVLLWAEYQLLQRFFVEKYYVCFLVGGSICATVCALIWISSSNIFPEADQFLVSWYADALNGGDYSSFLKREYLSVHTNQWGIVTYLRIVFGLFGEFNYKAVQYLNAAAVGGTVFCAAKYAEELSGDRCTAALSMLLSLGCVPLILYTAFVYGEIPSIFCSVCALWLFTKTMHTFRWSTAVLCALVLGFGIWVRWNTVIVLIAVVLVLLYKLLTRPKTRWLLILLLLLGASAKFQVKTIELYQSHIPEDAASIPSVAWIAMGVNDEGGYAGMYDGTEYRLADEYEYDSAKISEASIGIVKEFAKKCIQNPAYAFDFYWRKINLQWSAPMYQALEMNQYTEEGHGWLAEQFYDGLFGTIASEYMNIYQLAGYAAVAILLLSAVRRKEKLEDYTGVIAIFGGFWFTMIWENKARYVLPYLVLMIPFMAMGFLRLTGRARMQMKRAKERSVSR